MGLIFSFMRKTSFYKFYNYDDSCLDSEENYTDREDEELQCHTEINLYDPNYNTYTGYEYEYSGVIYNIKD